MDRKIVSERKDMVLELNIPKPDCATDGAQLEDIHNFNRHPAIYV